MTIKIKINKFRVRKIFRYIEFRICIYTYTENLLDKYFYIKMVRDILQVVKVSNNYYLTI